MVVRVTATAVVTTALMGCGDASEAARADADGPAGGAAGAPGPGGGGHGGSGGGSSSTGGGGDETVYDPAQLGPYAYQELDDTTPSPVNAAPLAIHCAYPTGGPGDGPFPVVLFGRGFQLPPTLYYEYLRRLASFGYVALTVDYPTPLLAPSHVDGATDLLAGIDWAGGAAQLVGIADTATVGATGHSLGGKLSLLAATVDDRIKASITLDPVDTATGCSPADCPDVSAMLPLPIPTGFIGETIDATGAFQACAPAADNFQNFYAAAASPSLSVHVLGASHVSFVDDLTSCGLPCSFCNPATAGQGQVLSLARATVVAFFERYLKNHTAYDEYLTGPTALERYVATGQATIEFK